MPALISALHAQSSKAAVHPSSAVTLLHAWDLWYTQMFRLWYMTYRATSSLRLADTTGAVRARTGVFWGAASLAPKQLEAFIERAMIAKCGSRLGLQPGAFLSLLGFCIRSRPWHLGYRRAEARALDGRASLLMDAK